jgi:hypothetical protein
MAKRRRKPRDLRDWVGPQTQRYQAIRDGIRGLRRANDRGACKDAAALLRLTEQAMVGLPVMKAERERLDAEKTRHNRGCRRGKP